MSLSSRGCIFALTGNNYVHFFSKTAYTGETLRIRCGHKTLTSPVDWRCRRQYESEFEQIISGGHLTGDDDFGGRLNINGSTLIINNVQTNDSGIYICIEDTGQGMRHNISLSVNGKLSE